MIAKQFHLGLFLLLSSDLTVTRKIHPLGLTPREIEIDSIIDLPTHAPGCGDGAHYGDIRKACLCNDTGEIYDPRTPSCACLTGNWYDGVKCTTIPSCGSAAHWKVNKCVDNNPVLNFSKADMTCACPFPKDLVGDI